MRARVMKARTARARAGSDWQFKMRSPFRSGPGHRMDLPPARERVSRKEEERDRGGAAARTGDRSQEQDRKSGATPAPSAARPRRGRPAAASQAEAAPGHQVRTP